MAGVRPTGDPSTGRVFKHRVLDEIAERLSRSYVQTLQGINAALSGLFHRAHGVEKGEGLYLDLADDSLMKAAKPTAPKAKAPTAPKAKVKSAKPPKARDPQGTKHPGSRGSTKWWRDKHGHVHYGKKPEHQDEHKWEAMSDDEVDKLYESVEATYDVSPYIQRHIFGSVAELGYDPGTLRAVFADARALGMSVEDYFVQSAVKTGASEEDAEKAWGDMLSAYRDALEDPAFKKKAREAVKHRMLRDQAMQNRLGRSDHYTEGAGPDLLLKDDPKHAAMKLLGLMSDMELFHIPSHWKEVEKFDETADSTEKHRAVGRIILNKNQVESLGGWADSMNASQIMALYLGERLGNILGGGEGELKAEGWKDTKGKWSSEMSGRENIDDLFSAAMEAALDKDELSDSEHVRLVQKIHQIGHECEQLITAYNDDAGGEVVGTIFSKSYPVKNLFKNPDEVEHLAKLVEEKKKLIADSLEAQQSDNFKTPESMKAGFKSMTEEAQAKGKVTKEYKADLIDYQRKALNWMDTIKRGILAYDTGMGKTPMSIAYVAHLMELAKAGKIDKQDARGILTMPLGLTKQWPNEIRRFFPDAKVEVLGDDMTTEERIEKLEMIRDGDIDADFVIVSASVVGWTKETLDRFRQVAEEEVETENGKEWRKKEKMPQEEYDALMEEYTSQDKLANSLRSLRGCAFFDEAHHPTVGLKNPSNKHRACAKEMLKDRERAFFLTATPMPNGKPEELFHMMDAIHPGSAGPDVSRFAAKACEWEEVYDAKTGKHRMEMIKGDDWEKLSKDVAPYVFIKAKTDDDILAANKKAGMLIPELSSETHTLVNPTSVQRLMEHIGDYEPIEWHGKDKTFKPLEKLKGAAEKLRILTQQQQMGVSPRILLGDPDLFLQQAKEEAAKANPSDKKIAHLKSKAAKARENWNKYGYHGEQPKIEHMTSLIQKHFNDPANSDSPIIIFTSAKAGIQHARQALINAKMDPSLIGEIHGDISAEDRDVVQEAVNAGKMKVVFVGVEAGGAGLNLQKKTKLAIYLDQPWTPATKQQTLGRFWRTGNPYVKEGVRAVNLQLNGTVDEHKMMNMKTKMQTIVAVSNAKDGGEVAANNYIALIHRALGKGTDIVNRSDADIQKDLDKLGLKGVVTPNALKTQFDISPFKETLKFKQYLAFGRDEAYSRQSLNDGRLKRGTITKEEHAAAKEKIDSAMLAWHDAVVRAGEEPVAMPKDLPPRQPESSYVLLSSSGAPKGLSPEAQHLLTSMKQHKGSITASDYINKYLVEHMAEKQAADQKGSPKEKEGMKKEARQSIADRLRLKANEDAMRSKTKRAFKELEHNGLIAGKHIGTDRDDEAPHKPEPSKGKPKPDKSPGMKPHEQSKAKKQIAKKVKETAQAEAGATKWTHAVGKLPAAKPADMSDGAWEDRKDMITLIKQNKAKINSPADLARVLWGVKKPNSKDLADAAKLEKRLRDWGYLK